jgi:DNA polymerase-3 subunit epsilon
LLAEVYLELRGGRERGFDLSPVQPVASAGQDAGPIDYGTRPRPLAPRLTDAERAAHAAFVAAALKDKAIWLKYRPTAA